ncbi:MAG: AraC family transcriptional regulator [Ruminococcaceae bacterium]|nr:AraC family transcriptional regulator [Oscillospiraceae bacterium]
MRKEFFNTKKHNLDLYMINCGYEDCCTNFVCVPHIRRYHLIHYVTKGTGYYEANGQKHFIKEGDIFVIYPDDLITYYSPDVNNTWSFCWIGFSGKKASEYLKMAGITGYTRSIKGREFPLIISSCLNYIDENKNNISQLKLNSYILDGLFALSKVPSSASLSPVEQVDKGIRYIEYNYMNAITAKDVSAYLSLERTYFYRIFKKYTGSSPEQYIIKYRIRKSTELIKLEKYSVTEIAKFVGIKDVYYFSRLFKKVLGVSPTQYKKLH